MIFFLHGIDCLKIRFEKMDYQASIKSKVGWSMNGLLRVVVGVGESYFQGFIRAIK